MPMTATQILTASLPAVKEAARYVVVKDDVVPSFVNKPNDKKMHKAPKIDVSVYSTADSHGAPKKGSPKKYRIQIISLNAEKKLHEAPLLVRCSCDYFTFNCEVALTKRGASAIKQSNGEKPVVRNPSMIPTPCKHLYKVLTILVKRRM